MKALFSLEGRKALSQMMANDPLLAFDFDGTLAPIVPCPDRARIPDSIAQRMKRLAERRPVAVITGRAIADVQARLPFEPWRIFGSHGAESQSSAQHDLAVQAIEPARRHLNRRLHEFCCQGILLEDKGASIAIHYRSAPNRDAALGFIAQTLSSLPEGFSIFGSKMAANIIPARARDKAHALAELVAERESPHALFFGDDTNDECVFANASDCWLTVRIGHEYPNSQADFALDRADELPSALDLMLQDA
jgi:trehalose 6-phosphate phosphatase